MSKLNYFFIKDKTAFLSKQKILLKNGYHWAGDENFIVATKCDYPIVIIIYKNKTLAYTNFELFKQYKQHKLYNFRYKGFIYEIEI